jgi:hypothetical protein
MTITMELEVITPARAEAMLGCNTRNRHLGSPTVNNYARMMKEGNWILNGDAIRFAVDGTLLDGQHRLAACILANLPLTTWVGRGFPVEAQMTMDAQRKRTAGDVLTIEGFHGGNVLASIVRMVYRWERGQRNLFGFGGAENNLTTLEVVQRVQDDKDELYITAAKQAGRAGIKKMATPKSVGAFFVLASRVDPERAQVFFDRLDSDVDHHKGSPILTLRRNWSRLNNDKGRTSTPGVYLMGGVRCWNAWMAGRSLEAVVWKDPNIPELISSRRRRNAPPLPLAEGEKEIVEETG